MHADRWPSLAAIALLGLALTACGPPAGEDRVARRPTPEAEARAGAIREIEALESAVRDARARVAAAETPTGAEAPARRQAISDTRRAIVVSNVALQKAREALVAGDYGQSRLATSGAADRLRAIAGAIPSSLPPDAAAGVR